MIAAIFSDFVKFFNFKTKKGIIRLVFTLVILIVATQVFTRLNKPEVEPPADPLKIVTVGTAESIINDDGFSLIGTVESKNQVQIQAEAAGRVTTVLVELGDELTAGTVIAELENASQYATLLQAEGSYEAALAAAAQSDVSVESAQTDLTSAQNNAMSIYRNAYTSVNSIVLNTIDSFYANPQGNIVGVKINTPGDSVTLSELRKKLNTTLADWNSLSTNVTTDSDWATLLTTATLDVEVVIGLVDSLIGYTTEADATDTLNGALVSSYTTGLTSARASLNATLTTIENAETTLTSAEDRLRRAQIGGTNTSELSAANAQVKQALGTLRAAQANYQKTIIRTPIAGTLNELAVKSGDFVTQFSPVALVANNKALEITTYVGESDALRISVGQTVYIENNVEAVVTAIAPGIDSGTRKTEVKIGTESETLQTGDTVTIDFSNIDAKIDSTAPILIPITAVKFNASNGTIFTVMNNKLSSVPVEIGPIVGSFVTITDGLARNAEFVLDARGLTEGLEVEAVTN